MRRLTLLCSLALLAIACDNTSNRFIINGTIHGTNDGEMIILRYPIKRGDIWYSQYDTTYLENGHFRFEGVTPNIMPASLISPNMDDVDIYIEPTHITFTAERNALYDFTLQGLSIDNELADYRTTFGALERAIFEKRSAVTRKNREWSTAYDEGSERADSLWAEFYDLAMEYHAITSEWPAMAIKFVEEHPNYTITTNIQTKLLQQGYNIHIDNQTNGAMKELLAIRQDIVQSCGGKVGSKALDFELEDVSGKKIRLSDCYAEGYVLLDFWASWCHPCINEIPKLRSVHEEFGNRLQIISLSVDSDRDKWLKAVEQYNLNLWPQLINSLPTDAANYYFREQGDISLAYGVEYIPCFMLIDRQGTIVARWSHLTDESINEIRELTTGELCSISSE